VSIITPPRPQEAVPMKTELNPVAAAVLIGIVVILAGYFLFKAFFGNSF
jgi:hypothetical protein